MEPINNQNTSEKRVVSFFIWDPELERKIDCEVKMIDGIGKLLNVATTLEQTIEGHKALVLSQQRMLAFMAEIQRKQQNLLQRDNPELEPTKATVILSDIRLPLVWKNMKAKSEQKKFAVFCLARMGCEIIDTQMKFIDKQSTDIVFSDKIIFDHVPHNFQLNLEIYALNKSLALSSSAKDFANRYSYFSAYGSSNLSRERPDTNQKSSHQHRSKFVLIAHTIFTKESVSQMTKVRYLNTEPRQENPLMQLPIHNSFLARFVAQPLCYRPLAIFTGIAEVDQVRYACVLTAGFLNGEEIMRNDWTDQDRFSIPITPETVILAREDPLVFSISNPGVNPEEFFVQDLFTLNNWIRALQQHIVDIRAWQVTFEHLPSMRRYSHQSSPISPINGENVTKKSILTTKARSLENLYQTNIPSQSLMKNRIDQSEPRNHVIAHLSADEDEDNDETEYLTRL